MSNNRFYINREGIHDNTILGKALQFAQTLLQKDPSIERIVFYFSGKENDKCRKWFGKDYSNKTIETLWNGYSNNGIYYQAESERTYPKHNCYIDIVISLGCETSVLDSLDKHETAKYIIAVPWLLKLTEEWIRKNNAQIIETD